MRELRPLYAVSSTSDSWLQRVLDNFHQLFMRSMAASHSANGAPIHVLTVRGDRSMRSQAASFFVHAMLVAALLTAAKTVLPTSPATPLFPVPVSRILASAPRRNTEHPSLGHKGGGGENNPEPPRHGLVPHSTIQLLPPRLPDQQNHPLPVMVTILDPAAPIMVSSISGLGVPDSTLNTNSAGPGHNGIGRGKDGGAGNSDGDGDGAGDEAGTPAVSLPTCSYCPIPVYTDEARHVKIQGTVTLRVKVGTDGRATDIRVVRGIGYGLEDRAKETVSTWRFKPARDTGGRAIPIWITIEAVFHLF